MQQAERETPIPISFEPATPTDAHLISTIDKEISKWEVSASLKRGKVGNRVHARLFRPDTETRTFEYLANHQARNTNYSFIARRGDDAIGYMLVHTQTVQAGETMGHMLVSTQAAQEGQRVIDFAGWGVKPNQRSTSTAKAMLAKLFKIQEDLQLPIFAFARIHLAEELARNRWIVQQGYSAEIIKTGPLISDGQPIKLTRIRPVVIPTQA